MPPLWALDARAPPIFSRAQDFLVFAARLAHCLRVI
jgi:hypothetical protein